MQVNGTTYGIVPDDFNTILNTYLTQAQSTFPNATTADSPIYTMCYISAQQDQILQSALASLWNALNANTAEGTGLDILSDTILNLKRPELIQSSVQAQVTIGPVYSVVQARFVVDAVSVNPVLKPAPGTVQLTGFSTLSPYYITDSTDWPNITSPGVYFINFYSLDTYTAVSSLSFTGTNIVIPGMTFTSVSNPLSAALGSFTIPSDWALTSDSINNAPIYKTRLPYTFRSAGTYTVLTYSDNLDTQISSGQLNVIVNNLGGKVLSVTNTYAGILGTPAFNDKQFRELRKNYLNVEGQTYNGLVKAVEDLDIPGLQSIFVAETITDEVNQALLILRIVTTASVVIPLGWSVVPSVGPFPTPAFSTLQQFSFSSAGTYYVPLYSSDLLTVVPIGSTFSPSIVISNISSISNLDPSLSTVFGTTSGALQPFGLGERGVTAYLSYPTIFNSVSTLTMRLDVTAVGGSAPYIINPGWQATGFSTLSPYVTTTSYFVSVPGVYYLQVQSTDLTTTVPPNSFTGGTAVSGLTFTSTNTTAANRGQGFDTGDPNLQLVAQTLFNFHALGTNFYPATIGSTYFNVKTPYSGYSSNVILNPFQTVQVTVNLLLRYNTDAQGGSIFNVSLLPTLKDLLRNIINNFFKSKTDATNLTYTINELIEVINHEYAGIVALVGNSPTYFSFGTLGPTVNGLLYITKPIGSNFNLTDANFNFLAKNKNDP
jgi:hypothetical protein